MNVSDVVTILGALGIGSVIGQYLVGGQQRREIRSRVLGALEKVEDLRWADSGETPIEPFREALHQLETAALIARVPRHVVSHYIFMAAVAWRVSLRSRREFPSVDRIGGALPYPYANLVTEAAGDVAKCVWSPWFALTGVKRRAKKREARVESIDDELVSHAVESTRGHTSKRF